jgi:exonuclease VII large subunit
MAKRGKCPDDFVAIGGVPVCTAAMSAASSTWRSQKSELAVWRKSAHAKLYKFLDKQDEKAQLAGGLWQRHTEKEQEQLTQEEQRRKDEEQLAQKKKQRESSARRKKENNEQLLQKENERRRSYYYYYNYY